MWGTVQVNSLRSYSTELPYDYYSLPFCKPTEEQKWKGQGDANPGTVLLGLRIEASPYSFKMMVRIVVLGWIANGKSGM